MIWLFARMGCASTAGYPMKREYLSDPVDGGCVTWDEAVALYESENDPGLVPFLEEGVQAHYPDLNNGQPDLTAPRFYHMWDSGVPVYSYADAGTDPCANPGGGVQRLVVGFAPVIITDVYLAPDHIIEGRVICDQYTEIPERGGGGNFGLKGTIPGLVR